jgi:hypothetical protein
MIFHGCQIAIYEIKDLVQLPNRFGFSLVEIRRVDPGRTPAVISATGRLFVVGAGGDTDVSPSQQVSLSLTRQFQHRQVGGDVLGELRGHSDFLTARYSVLRSMWLERGYNF